MFLRINSRDMNKWAEANDEPYVTEAEVRQLRQYLEYVANLKEPEK